MYLGRLISTLMGESGFIPLYFLINFWQRNYVDRFLSLPHSILTKDILPITLRVRDKNLQPGNQPDQDAL